MCDKFYGRKIPQRAWKKLLKESMAMTDNFIVCKERNWQCVLSANKRGIAKSI